jgi:hypothetical protein
MGLGQTTGFDHVGVHPQLNLPRNSQDFPVGNAQARNRLMDPLAGLMPHVPLPGLGSPPVGRDFAGCRVRAGS